MSEGLKALENILKQELIKPNKYRKTIGDIASAGQIITIQKELKALETIKYKGLDVGVLQGCFERNETVKEYLRYSDDDCNCEEEQLTQEEYDLLKEVLL